MTDAPHLYQEVSRLHFWEGHLQVLDDLDATGLIDTDSFDFRGIRHGISESQSWLGDLSRELNGWHPQGHPYFIRYFRVITDRLRWQLASLDGSKELHRPLHRPSKLQLSTIIALSFNHYQLHICQAASTCIITQMLSPQRQRRDKNQICRRKGLRARGGRGRVRRARAIFIAKCVSAAGQTDLIRGAGAEGPGGHGHV